MKPALNSRAEAIETGKGCLLILAAFGALGGVFIGPFVCLMVLNTLLLNPVSDGTAAAASQVRNTVESTFVAVAESTAMTPTTTTAIEIIAPAVADQGGIAPTVIPTEAASEETGANTVVLDYDPARVAAGEVGFASLCAACHGPDAHGLPNLGLDLVQSEFMHSLDDQELLIFVKTGRPIWDPNNTTGVDMPPRGGNPALSDDEILSIIAYLRTLAVDTGQ